MYKQINFTFALPELRIDIITSNEKNSSGFIFLCDYSPDGKRPDSFDPGKTNC